VRAAHDREERNRAILQAKKMKQILDPWRSDVI
jgi:hypothetical protein